MKTKIIIICGPTGTGKTKLGIYLAKKLNGEIISADSRQVYKGMTIGTGKEYSKEVVIWGYDLVSPNEEFSVSHFKKYAEEKIHDIVKRKKLPIIVGGTGLYIKALIEDLSTIEIPPDVKLREELSILDAPALYKKLTEIAPQKAKSLNNSDMNNPRRLIRAIEVASSKLIVKSGESEYDALLIVLSTKMEILLHRLNSSVEKRLQSGFLKEVQDLYKSKITKSALSATGYKEYFDVIDGKISEKEAVNLWKTREKQYIKRQLTWFKKLKNTHWFDISEANFEKKVEDLVDSWNNS